VRGASAGQRADGPAPASGWAALVVVYVVWGSTYLAIRVADESLPPLVMASVRYLIAATILFPLVIGSPADRSSTVAQPSPGRRPPVRARGANKHRPLSLPSPRQLAGCALIGVLLLACGNGGVTWAERTVPSGLAALLLASVPLWMVIADRALTNAAPSRLAIVALVVGFAGIVVLSHPGGKHVPYTGIAVILVAAICWAVGSVIGRKVPQPTSALVATAFQMLAGGLALALAAAISGEAASFDAGAVSLRSWLALAYLIGPGSVLALSCYTAALRLLPTPIVSTYAYVNPIIAVVLGWLVLGEKVSLFTVIGGALVVTAVVLVVTDRRRRALKLTDRRSRHTPATG
jgi:drug/metabolite transporter (DMT)-like permease